MLKLDSADVSIFVVKLVELTDNLSVTNTAAYVNSTNISTNIKTAVL